MRKTNPKLKTFIFIIFLVYPIVNINYALVFADSSDQDFSDSSMVYTETVVFDPPGISRYLDKYYQVKMDGCGTITLPGHPSLPVKTISLIFDLNDDITNVTVRVSTYELNGTYLVSPAPKASINGTGDLLTDPDPTIYSSSDPYPGIWYDYELKEGIDPKTMRRVKFLILHVYPVQYSPVTGKITTATEAQMSVLYETGEQVASSLALERTLSPVYDLLIITSPALEVYASTLSEYKNSVGISTFIKTTDEVYSSYSGRDNPEKIRNYIKNAVESFGITYVLIFGDADQVPVRYAYIPDGNDDDIEEDDGVLVETDLYYADLQYSWDDNDDGLWGDLEYDQVDGVPDLLVGRLPVSLAFYAAAIVTKTINYERFNSPDDPWFNRVLLLGTDPFEYPGAEGEILMEYIADEFVWSNFTVNKLYSSHDNLSSSNVQTQINDGFGFVSFAGHGWYNSWSLDPDYYMSTDASNLRNGLKLPIVFNFACFTSRFADYECIGEYFMANPDGGAIAYFGATRSGWAYSGDLVTTGLSGEMTWRFNKAFFDGNWISGAVWGQAITEYVQSNPIESKYRGYYKDWKIVAAYGSPFMDPTLMIGGRALEGEEETYSASIVDLEAPSEVYVGESFTVDLTVSYEFTTPTEMSPGIYDLETETWITEEYETLVGEGTKIYSFELTAPEEETTWSLGANVWYYSEGEWVHDEADWVVFFDIQVREEETYSASIVDLEAPSEVYVGESFTVDLTVSYNFTVSTRMLSGIYDMDAERGIAIEEETLVGEGTWTYSFELTAPEEETTWSLGANVWYYSEGEWAHDEENYSDTFEVSVFERVVMPMTVYGIVYFGTDPAPAGFNVSAKYGATILDSTLTTATGAYALSLEGPANGASIGLYVGTENVVNITLSYMAVLEQNLRARDISGIPEIEVSPTYGVPGATITVTGLNFTQIAGTEVTITMDTIPVSALVTAETDADGSFEATFTVPAVTFATYTVTATDEYSIEADDAFRVGLIALIINPISGEAGTKITITGIGFENGSYNVTFGDELYEDYGAVVGGVISDYFYVPNVAPGVYSLVIVDTAENELSGQFTVTESTTASIDPVVAPNGYNVSLSGNNFADITGGAVTFEIYNTTEDWSLVMDVWEDGAGSVAADTNSDGNFTGWWIVPADTVLSLGDYTINVTDSQDLLVQLSFSVVAARVDVASRKALFDIGDTISFDISTDFELPGSYIEIYSPDDALYWITDAFTDVWVLVDDLYTVPYYQQTANSNPMELQSDAHVGTWTYFFYDVDDDELMNGVFAVGPSTADRARASIIDVEAPSEVYVEESFTVDVTVSYAFTVPTEMASGIYDMDTGRGIATEEETLVGAGTQTYSFELTAPEEETTWALGANVWYYSEGEWAHDEENYSDTFEVSVMSARDPNTHEIQLFVGWNLVSLPLIPDDSAIAVVLADVMGNVTIVWSYQDGAWLRHLPAVPSLSTLTTIEDGKAYWIQMAAADNFTVTGVELPDPGVLPPVYSVTEGWNMIGFKSVTSMEINTYLTTIPELVRASAVGYGWDSSLQAYEMVYLAGAAVDSAVFEPGQGYWLYLPEDAAIAPPAP